MSAGGNEKKFEKLLRDKFGDDCLRGRKSFSLRLPDHETAHISVDQSIELEDGTVILIEVDSGNMAKLIAGQYVLLNGMYDRDRSKAHFLVVHYYKDYNPERTLKNLNAVQHFGGREHWISYSAFYIDDFARMIGETACMEEFVNCVRPNRASPQ